MKIHRVLLTLALFGFCASAFAQWQWLDADGRRVFSDRAPPPEVAEKNILKRPNGAAKAAPSATDAAANDPSPAPLAATSAPQSSLEKELQAKKKQVADAEAAKRKADEDRNTKTKIENCARAKQAKAMVDSGLRIARTNAEGEREVLDDTARASERARIQTIISSECK